MMKGRIAWQRVPKGRDCLNRSLALGVISRKRSLRGARCSYQEEIPDVYGIKMANRGGN